jgi:hypothetical protein
MPHPCHTAQFIIETYVIVNIGDFDDMNTTKRAATLFGNVDINAFPIIPASTTTNTPSPPWVFIPKSNMSRHHLPLTRPLVVECPISACVLPISSTYGTLSRFLYYANTVLATAATLLPVLRGVAQIALSASLASSFAYWVVLSHVDKVASRQIFNLDYAPMVLTLHCGLYSIAFWFFAISKSSKPSSALPTVPISSTLPTALVPLTPSIAAAPSAVVVGQVYPEQPGIGLKAGAAQGDGGERTMGVRQRLRNLRRWPLSLVISLVYVIGTIIASFESSHYHGLPLPWSLALIVFDPVTDNYRLTSTCYSDAFGAAHPWDVAVKAPLRRIGDAVLYTPRFPDILASEAIQLIPHPIFGRLFHISAIVMGVIAFGIGVARSPWKVPVVSRTSQLGTAFTTGVSYAMGQLNCTNLCNSPAAGQIRTCWRCITNNSLCRLLARRPKALLLIPMGVFLASIIATIVQFERVVLQKNPPVAEPPEDFGQWGQWVGAFVALVIAISAKWLWDIDASQSPGFGWMIAPKHI